MRAFLRGFLLLLSAVSGTPPGALASSQNQESDTSLGDLLAKVAKAVQYNNYRGRLTYEYAGKLEVIEVAHAVIDGREYERVDYLNGPQRAVSYGGLDVECTTRGRFLLRGGRLAGEDGSVQLSNQYDLKLLGVERVAGRPSLVVQMLPRDNNRHGLVLAFDEKTYLPTKSLVVAEGNKVLERFHFVVLDVGVEFATSDFDLAPAGSQNHLCDPNQKPERSAPWRPQWLPEGFVFSAYSYSETDGHKETYTDGLATFSLFTQTLDQLLSQGGIPASSTLSRGATVVLMRLLANDEESVHVSIVGEIPLETANRIVSSIAVQQVSGGGE